MGILQLNKQEFIWIWNHHKSIVGELMKNRFLINEEITDIVDEEFDTIHLNGYNLIKFVFDSPKGLDKYKDIDEEIVPKSISIAIKK